MRARFACGAERCGITSPRRRDRRSASPTCPKIAASTASCSRCRSRRTRALASLADGLAPRAHRSTAAERGAGAALRRALPHQDAIGRRGGRHALGRQSAEGRARAMAGDRAAVLILDEPTQGVDVGSKAEIHALMQDARRAGPGDHHDLVGAAGDSRHERPHRGHARRHDRAACSIARRSDAGARGSRARRSHGCTGMRTPRSVGRSSPSPRSRCRARRRGAAASSPATTSRDLLLANMPGADRRARHDAGDPHRPDRHLRRLGVRDLQRRRGRARESRAADAPAGARGVCSPARLLGAVNGALVAYARIPSIVVTLATMVALRDGLRWVTQGAWVQDLPADFQWLGSVAERVSVSWRAPLRPL